MRTRSTLSVALLGLAASGCTHLEVEKHNASSNSARSGYAYMLDFTQYQTTLTRTLAACDDGDLPTVKTQATITPTLAPDGEQVYVIDPSAMISAFKTSDISVDYKDGRLVGFNASGTDKTAEVLSSVITSAGKIIALGAGVPIAVSEGGSASLCTPQAIANLKLIENNKKPIEDATAQLDAASATLSTLTAQFAAKPTRKRGDEIRQRTANIAAARKQLDGLTKTVTAAQGWLTDSVTFTWPQTSLVFHDGPSFPLSSATTAKWFRVDAMKERLAQQPKPWLRENDQGVRQLAVAGENGAAALLGLQPPAFQQRYPHLVDGINWDTCRNDAACASEIARFEADAVETQLFRSTRAPVSLHIVRRGSYGSEGGSHSSADRRAGLRYRMPAAGVFYICEVDQPCFAGSHQAVAKAETAVAQLGTVFNIPFSSPAFASGGVSVSFDDQGRLLKAGLKRDNSAALAAAGVLGTAADQTGSLYKAFEAEELTDLNNAAKIAKARKELDEAQAALTKTPAQLATEALTLLETQQKIETIRAAMAPSQTKDLTTQVAIAKLEVDLAETRKKLEQDPHADQNAVKRQYDTQAAVFNARKASLEAEAAVFAAERELAKARALQ